MALKLDTDRVVSLSAMVVGVGSLFIILHQTHLMRQAQSAAVYPHLAISITSNTDGVYFVLRNTGVGPARIDDVRVRHDGREHAGDAYDFYIHRNPDGDNSTLSLDRVMRGRLIPAGEGVQMIGRSGRDQREMLKELLEMFEIAEVPRSWLSGLGIPLDPAGRAVLEVSYSSVYDERWTVRSDSMVPVER